MGRLSIPAAPVLGLGETVQDFGRVVSGEIVSKAFSLNNAGSRRLVVNEFTCALCESKPQTTILQPGESVEVVVSLDTSGQQGTLRRVRNFSTNDPQHPKFTLEVLADVQAP